MAGEDAVTVYGLGLPPGEYNGRWTGLGAFRSLAILVPRPEVSEEGRTNAGGPTPSDDAQSASEAADVINATGA